VCTSSRQKRGRAHSPTHDIVQALRPGLSVPGLLSTRSPTSVNVSEWRGKDLNLRPSGYETQDDCLLVDPLTDRVPLNWSTSWADRRIQSLSCEAIDDTICRSRGIFVGLLSGPTSPESEPGLAVFDMVPLAELEMVPSTVTAVGPAGTVRPSSMLAVPVSRSHWPPGEGGLLGG
jgi:hypothetical protein